MRRITYIAKFEVVSMVILMVCGLYVVEDIRL